LIFYDVFGAFVVSLSSFCGRRHSLWCSVAIPAKFGDYRWFSWFQAAFVVFTSGFLCSLAIFVVFCGVRALLKASSLVSLSQLPLEIVVGGVSSNREDPYLVAVSNFPYPRYG
jgi:hypothetical protein